MATVKVPGFRMYNTSRNTENVDQLDLTQALNVYWSGNTVEIRDGSSLWKNDAQTSWGRIMRARTFKKRADSFFYVVIVTNGGRVFYIRSDNANFGTPSVTWTELNSPASTTPALAASKDRYALFPFNNRLYLADSTNGYFSWDGSASDLTAETDPPSLSTNNIIDFDTKSNRLVALDDGGLTHLSAVNNGQNFTTVSGGGVLNYGRVEGLIATGTIPFGDDLLIATEDVLSYRYQTYRLEGIQFFDPAVVGSDTSQFEVRKVTAGASIIGESGQQITGDTVGLTIDGFISFNQILNKDVLTERDYLSFPIKELIEQINFAKADKISSAVDKNGRYYCAVPYGTTATEANVILCYDFRRSSPSEGVYRWSLISFNSFNEIGTLFTIQGDLYATDILGNIYKLNDSSKVFADEDADGANTAINCIVKTAAIGGQDIGIEKDFGVFSFLVTNLYDKFDLNVDLIINGRLIAEDIDETPFLPITIELPQGSLLYDTSGLLYDDFNLYDSGGTNRRVVTLTNRGGRANSIQWQFSTNTTGKSWGIGSFAVEVEGMEIANEAGTSNHAVI